MRRWLVAKTEITREFNGWEYTIPEVENLPISKSRAKRINVDFRDASNEGLIENREYTVRFVVKRMKPEEFRCIIEDIYPRDSPEQANVVDPNKIYDSSIIKSFHISYCARARRLITKSLITPSCLNPVYWLTCCFCCHVRDL